MAGRVFDSRSDCAIASRILYLLRRATDYGDKWLAE